MSLRTGGQVALATPPIINPNNLKVDGWYCQDRFSKDTLILLSQDVRDFIKQGLVINDHDNLSTVDELIRLKDILNLNFELLGKPVVTLSKQKIGKVSYFAVEIDSLNIQKIYLTRPILKNLSGGSLGVDRSQIIEITNRKIVIQEPLKPAKAGRAATAPVPT